MCSSYQRTMSGPVGNLAPIWEAREARTTHGNMSFWHQWPEVMDGGDTVGTVIGTKAVAPHEQP